MNLCKLLPGALTIAVVWLLVVWPSTGTATVKGEQLRRAMADITLLNGQLVQRKTDAAGIRDALTVRLNAIKAETDETLRKTGIKSQAEALKNPRLFYDLMLIAEIQAYIDRYVKKIAYYRVAGDRLNYLYQQADDELKIDNTLSGMKIDALVSQVEKILDTYLPDGQTLVIHPGSLTIDPPEKIWNALSKTDN